MLEASLNVVRRRGMNLSILAPLVAIACLVCLSGPALAQDSAAQYSADNLSVLVNKSVDDERWVVGYRLSDGFVTGNVLNISSGEVTFISCYLDENDGETGTFRCLSAAPCMSAPCPEEPYTPFATTSLPLAFFLPPGEPTQPPPDDRDIFQTIFNWVLYRADHEDGSPSVFAVSENDAGDVLRLYCYDHQSNLRRELRYQVLVAAEDVFGTAFDAKFTIDPGTSDERRLSVPAINIRGNVGFVLDDRLLDRLYGRSVLRVGYQGAPADQIVEFDIRGVEDAFGEILRACGEE